MGKIYNEKVTLLCSKKGSLYADSNHVLVKGIFEPIRQNGRDIYYISQDNYYMADILNVKDSVFYCDSATSCVVIVVVGFSSREQKTLAAISHLSRPGRFENFFKLVEETFNGEIKVYASGANPPYPCEKSDHSFDYSALRNATQVSEWVASGKNNFKQLSLKFGQGNPSVYSHNLDCFSISYNENLGIEVTNNRIYLTDDERDPSGGVQTLYCIFGDPTQIRPQNEPFSKVEIDELVAKAREDEFYKAADMSDEEILSTYSSTPDYEVPWFCSTIRKAGDFTKNY